MESAALRPDEAAMGVSVVPGVHTVSGVSQQATAASTPDDAVGPPEKAAEDDPPRTEPIDAESKASPAEVRKAQQLLARLGYRPGPPDGVYGQRTERAIRAFQQRQRVECDGQVSPELLAALSQAVRSEDRVRRSRQTVLAAKSTPGPERGAEDVVGSLAGGLQRLLGYEINSRTRPQSIRAYCLGHPDTWIYDEGRREFVFCSRLVASRAKAG